MLCFIDGCSNDKFAKGMCVKHYGRVRRQGDASITLKPGDIVTQPEYKVWANMKSRCNNPNAHNYHNYGARGIKVCERWMNSYNDFISDMGRRPDGLTLGRIDNNGNYEPSNCRWETWSQQLSNRRSKADMLLFSKD